MNFKLYSRQLLKMAAQNLYLPAVYASGIRKERRREKQAGAKSALGAKSATPAEDRRRPVRILFADAHHDTCPESMQQLVAFLKENRLSSAAVSSPDARWGSVPGMALSGKYRPCEIKELYLDYGRASFGRTMGHMTRFMQLYAGADAVVLCDNFLPAAGCRKRKGTKVVQLWHACGAMKRFGYDTDEDIPAGYRGNVFRNISCVTVSSPHCTTPFAAAMRLPKRYVRPVGVSRTDRYFDAAWREEMTRRFYQSYPQARGKKVVVWAPTFRGNPGAPRYLTLDLTQLAGELGEDYLLIEKQHPHVERLHVRTADRTQRPGAASVLINCAMTTQELFPVTDVLIADYSSLIYEYLLQNSALVLYAPDYAQYARERGFYMDYGEIPGIRVDDPKDLAEAVRAAQGIDEKNARKEITADHMSGQIPSQKIPKPGDREIFLEKWMSACDGHSTRRIAAYLLR